MSAATAATPRSKEGSSERSPPLGEAAERDGVRHCRPDEDEEEDDVEKDGGSVLVAGIFGANSIRWEDDLEGWHMGEWPGSRQEARVSLRLRESAGREEVLARERGRRMDKVQDPVASSRVRSPLIAHRRLVAQERKKKEQRRGRPREKAEERRAGKEVWVEQAQKAAEMLTRVPHYQQFHPDARHQYLLAESGRNSVEGEHPDFHSRTDTRRCDVRLNTFLRGPQPWPLTDPSADTLARVGFMYSGMEDTVVCHSCRVELSDWAEPGTPKPLLRHYTSSPACSFILQSFREQLPGLQAHQDAQRAKYANTSVRLHSFTTWPFGDIVTSYQLASVGFYYSGQGAKVTCFSCGVEINEWKRGDIPLLVHRNRSPHCPFLVSIITKGPSTSSPRPGPTLRLLGEGGGAASLPDWTNPQTRLKSFKKLSPAFPIPREKLAAAGLYLLRLPDVMKCFSCSAVLQGWAEEEGAVERHHKASPDCPFLAKTHPSKLEQEAALVEPTFDPSSLPGPQFEEQTLEIMGRNLRPPQTTPTTPIPPSQSTPSIPVPPSPIPTPELSLAALCISDPHTHTAPSTTPSPFPSLQPPHSKLSHLSSKLYPVSSPRLAPSQPHSSHSPSSHPPSSLYPPPSQSISSESQSSFAHAPSQPRPHLPHSVSSSSALSTEAAGKLISLPPSHSSQPEDPSSRLSFPPSYSSKHPSTRPFFPPSYSSQPEDPSSRPFFPSSYPSQHPSSRPFFPPSYSSRPSFPPSYASQPEAPSSRPSFPPSYSFPSHSSAKLLPSAPSSLPSAGPLPTISVGAECVVCMDRPLEMVLVPCGHVCVCEICSSQISRCPICRTRKQMSVKVYYPY